MYVIEPIDVPSLQSSNLPANDHPVWSSGTTYAAGDLVSHNRVNYQSVQAANTGNIPPVWTVGVDVTWWVPISYVNRWRAFDRILGQSASNAELISYEIFLPRTINSIALFGLSADSLSVVIRDPDNNVVYSQLISLASSTEVYDAWTYCWGELTFSEAAVRVDLPGFSGNTLHIDLVSTGGTATVAEIFLGNNIFLGETTTGTQVGIRDYSIKERDEFGNISVVERGFTSLVTFNFVFNTEDATRIKKVMSRVRAKAAVYYADPVNPQQFGTLIPGIYKDFNIPLESVLSHGVLEVESLI